MHLAEMGAAMFQRKTEAQSAWTANIASTHRISVCNDVSVCVYLNFYGVFKHASQLCIKKQWNINHYDLLLAHMLMSSFSLNAFSQMNKKHNS